MLGSYWIRNRFASKDHFSALQGVELQQLTARAVGNNLQHTTVYRKPVFIRHGFNGLVIGSWLVQKMRR